MGQQALRPGSDGPAGGLTLYHHLLPCGWKLLFFRGRNHGSEDEDQRMPPPDSGAGGRRTPPTTGSRPTAESRKCRSRNRDQARGIRLRKPKAHCGFLMCSMRVYPQPLRLTGAGAQTRSACAATLDGSKKGLAARARRRSGPPRIGVLGVTLLTFAGASPSLAGRMAARARVAAFSRHGATLSRNPGATGELAFGFCRFAHGPFGQDGMGRSCLGL